MFRDLIQQRIQQSHLGSLINLGLLATDHHLSLKLILMVFSESQVLKCLSMINNFQEKENIDINIPTCFFHAIYSVELTLRYSLTSAVLLLMIS